jgi:hypothetical protein
VMPYRANAQNENDACNAFNSILQKTDGVVIVLHDTELKDVSFNEGKKGCIVKLYGKWSQLMDNLNPTDIIRPDSGSSSLGVQGWSFDHNYAADGKDGTVFGIRKDSVLCIVRGHWDGGDDSNPAYIRADEYNVFVSCASGIGN